MKVQAIMTNYATIANNRLSSRQKINKQNQEANDLSFKGFPIIHESNERIWKITGQEIIDASASKLKEWAEYLHKRDYLPESIYTVTKDSWWGGTKVDDFKTGVAYEKLQAAIEEVKEYKRNASPSEVERLDRKAEECEDKLSHMGNVTRIGGF